MPRLLFFAAAVLAAGLAAVPGILGLAGNPTFSRDVPLRPPSYARPAYPEKVTKGPSGAASASVPSRSSGERPPSQSATRDPRESEPADAPTVSGTETRPPDRSEGSEPAVSSTTSDVRDSATPNAPEPIGSTSSTVGGDTGSRDQG